METAEKLYYGTPLTAEEQQMVDRAPTSPPALVTHSTARAGARHLGRRHLVLPQPAADLSAEEMIVRRGAQLLKVASDFDSLEALGHATAQALDMLKGRAEQYDADVLTALQEVCGSRSDESIHEISLSELKVGMIFASDVKMTTGTLFVARGYEVTESFLQRIGNFRPGSVQQPLRVVVRND